MSGHCESLFTERMCLRFCLVPLQRARGSRYVPLSREVLRPRAPNDVMLMWDRRYFAENVNGFLVLDRAAPSRRGAAKP